MFIEIQNNAELEIQSINSLEITDGYVQRVNENF